ncbi:MAG: hypothetical protein LBS99_04060 [Clostridiales bacterium]|jgi:hypothetical protein|nr:hypothetical protein [Clostridiales bacterium]
MENIGTGGWTIEQTRRLFDLCDKAQVGGKGLRTAFERIAGELGRKPNSVRNYYYAHLKTFNLMPELSKNLGIKVVKSRAAGFKTFTSEEVETLIAEILKKQAEGMSVRRITQQMGGGDKSLTLRLQNKYRSIIFGRRKLADEIIGGLKRDKITYYNPYTRKVAEGGIEQPADEQTLIDSLSAITASLGDEQVKSLFAALARLAVMAGERATGADSDFIRGELIRKNKQIAELSRRNYELSERLNKLRFPSATGYDRLHEINRFFLEKAEADKIKGLGDYVQELKKVLEATN